MQVVFKIGSSGSLLYLKDICLKIFCYLICVLFLGSYVLLDFSSTQTFTTLHSKITFHLLPNLCLSLGSHDLLPV